ncbi:HD-GYP domain-containing protein [Thermodesulfobacteriota bacterium]
MNFNMTKCLEGISMALDFTVSNYLSIHFDHSRRVAYIALSIGTALNLSENDKKELFAFSLLHDNGLTLAGLKSNVHELTTEEHLSLDDVADKTILEQKFLETELMPDHCIEGERNIASMPMLKLKKDIIKYHHEYYDGSGIFGLKEDEIPLFSQIISLADTLDRRFDFMHLHFENRKEITIFVEDNRGTLFSSKVADAFILITEKERFWGDLSFHNMMETLYRISPEIIYEYSWDDIIEITETFMMIIDSKSEFTYRHSKGITEKVDIMSDHYQFDKEKKQQLHIAANLHDLGKLYVSNSILEKPGQLDTDEFGEIKKHAYFTRLALDKIPGFEDIARWASNHHEKLNGDGYPESFSADDLDFESRLLAVIDIYQALTEERPYRRPMPHDQAIMELKEMADQGEIDPKIVNDVDLIIGEACASESYDLPRAAKR